MSDSGLKIPSTTELEGRVREALKVARAEYAKVFSVNDEVAQAASPCFRVLTDIIRILEDGRS